MRSFAKNVLTCCLLTLLYTIAAAQQQYTQTVTAQNRNCNSTCSVLDIPSLAGNTAAIIMITPVLVNGVNANPHPIGVYYMYLNQWSVFNLDAAAISVGAKFNVEYYAASDSDHFVYVVPQKVSSTDLSYIDRTGLNNHPNAQVRVFPHVSASLGNTWNKEDVKAQYDAAVGKWFIANVNNTLVPSGSVYNVVFSNGGSAPGSPNNNTGGSCNCIIPTSLPPNGNAGGDLMGTYPNPTIRSLQGNALSNVQPTTGQVLKWDGYEWIPSNGAGSSGNTSTNKPSVISFNQNGFVDMDNSNVNTKAIVGLDNQTFTLSQSSRIVFHTTIDAEASDYNIVQGGAVTVWLRAEILNASNAVVAKSYTHTWLPVNILQTISATGIGILPAGTYRIRTSINRDPGGMRVVVFPYDGNSVNPFQGGQAIIEIFPD